MAFVVEQRSRSETFVAVWLLWFHDLPVPRVEPSLRGSGVW